MPSSPNDPNFVEIIPNRFFWTSRRTIPTDTADSHYFSIDKTFVYEPFSRDFGPLNLSMTYRYCKMVEGKLNMSSLAGKRIIHCCSQEAGARANTACLVCLYLVIMQRKTPKQAYQPFSGIDPPLLPFRDAITGPSTFDLTITDCLEGLQKAMELGWFGMDTFDITTYEILGNVHKLDASWVVPDKFIAFAGPSSTSTDTNGYPCFTPEDCIPIFRKAGIGLVIRLNNKQYDRQRFTENGIRHADLFFADGSCPSVEIISKFLCISENEPGPIAVHCKAGLGRTCTLLGLYAMKHFHFPARAFIGWNRICRPGSVLGPQQMFLVNMQEEMFQAGLDQGIMPPGAQPLKGDANEDGACSTQALSSPLRTPSTTLRPSLAPRPCSALGHQVTACPHSAGEQTEDVGQGERLCGAKRCGRLLLGEPAPGLGQPVLSGSHVFHAQAPMQMLWQQPSRTAPASAFAPPMQPPSALTSSGQAAPVNLQVPMVQQPHGQLFSHQVPTASAPSRTVQVQPVTAVPAVQAGIVVRQAVTVVAMEMPKQPPHVAPTPARIVRQASTKNLSLSGHSSPYTVVASSSGSSRREQSPVLLQRSPPASVVSVF